MGLSNEVVGLLLTLGSGLATTIGAALAFVVQKDNNLIFALCLALAAGVMVYVSFIEIFYKSLDEFRSDMENADAHLMACLTFFGGIALSVLMEHISNYCFQRATGLDGPETDASKVPPAEEAGVVPQELVDVEEARGGAADVDKQSELKERLGMIEMALFSGIAIAAHNFPEGIATFVAAVEDPEFGASMAIAIAIHNIPEGLAVAIPILKATNSAKKAFLWAFLSGIAEPIGAALAWIILKFREEVIGPTTFAILFGIVGGVMVHISLRKLIPTALKYDPENRVTSYAFFLGMAVMAASLVIFDY